MRLRCNINSRGRGLRFLLGSFAVTTTISYLAGGLNVTSAQVVTLGLGIFAIFEAVKGWCAVVELLERLRRGVTRKKPISLLLGSIDK